jgi:drug/metabolite transporter (DMT)-like permease
VAIMLAGIAAGTWGVADFMGGTAARRTPSSVVAMLAQMAGIVVLAAGVLLVPGQALPGAVGWGLVAGVAGGLGLPLMYRGLAEGPMNVVAPLTALTSASVPVVVGALLGERPRALVWVGVGLAVVAGVLVGVTVGPAHPVGGADEEPASRGWSLPNPRSMRGVGLALLSGLCFGGFFALLAQGAPAAGLWPVLAAKVSGSLIAGLAVLVALRSGGLLAGGGAGSGVSGRGWWIAVGSGVLDASANAVYLLAAHRGALVVVGAVVALYPASTVLLARVLDGERLGPVQRIGLALAVPALVLVSVG